MSLVVEHDFTVNISDPITSPTPIGFSFVEGDAITHTLNITLTNKGGYVSLSGATAKVLVIVPDGTKIEHSATTTNDVISATMLATCFAQPGRIYIYARVTLGTQVITPFRKYATVFDGITEDVI